MTSKSFEKKQEELIDVMIVTKRKTIFFFILTQLQLTG